MEIGSIQNLINILASNPEDGKAFFGAIKNEEKTISNFFTVILKDLMKEAGLNENDKNCDFKGIFGADVIFKNNNFSKLK